MANNTLVMVNNTLEEEGEMEVNSQDQATDMHEAVRSPEVVPLPDNTPCQVDKYLDFVAVNKHGHLLMGSSNLTGRYWGGSLWYYDNPSLAPDVEKCTAGFETSSGMADGTFLDNDKTVIVGQPVFGVPGLRGGAVCDGGSGGEQRGIKSECRVDEHLDAVHTVRVAAGRKSALTGSADMSIRVWDCQTCLVVRMLLPAHSQRVTDLSPHPTNDQIFLSCALDGNVLLWDLRCPKPASCVYRDYSVKPECVAWLEGAGEGHYLVGLQNGDVAQRCTTDLNYSLASIHALPRPLYRIAVNPKRLSQFAVCGNDSRVVVVDSAEGSLKLRYEDNSHTDFVRGLAWQDAETLISCGWDTNVIVHTV
ncbi:Methylosome protein 50 [Chionoecetes opilio]|uniref:Methylosome protein 50 n=1 Tax=Chionoecetes opilio TaxID=41210 RepID=A0A8J4YFF7_CHIOP|nr:Methylosome protein 50 [Chionoecetes opilio]